MEKTRQATVDCFFFYYSAAGRRGSKKHRHLAVPLTSTTLELESVNPDRKRVSDRVDVTASGLHAENVTSEQRRLLGQFAALDLKSSSQHFCVFLHSVSLCV